VTLTAAGTYAVTGSLTSGSVVIDAPDAVVNLVLDGVDITAAHIAAIDVVDAGQVVVWLADGSVNTLADASGAVVDETVEDAPNATLYSKSDLWIAGNGALSVTAHANDGITSKDSLVIAGGGAVTVTAADDGLRGKDHLVVAAGTVTVNAEGDALKSDNGSVTDQPDAAVGVIWIADGTLDLTSGSDGADAARQVTITGGDLTIATGDDGLHSDAVLRIDGGTIAITESVEGIEGAYMYLSGGDVTVAASDDAINGSGGLEALATVSGTAATADQGMAVHPGMPADQAAGLQGGRDSEFTNMAAVEDITTLTVSAMDGTGFGGLAEGDNGTMTMTGGTLVVSGTEDAANGALDIDDTFTVTGGTLAANGTSTMAVAPGETSTQGSLAMTFGGTVPAGTLITITDGGGTQIASFTSAKDSQSLIFSSSEIESGADYTISVGGTATGTSIGWLVLDGTAADATTIGTWGARPRPPARSRHRRPRSPRTRPGGTHRKCSPGRRSPQRGRGGRPAGECRSCPW